MVDEVESLNHEGLTMGTLIIGRQGTGKTSSLARILLDYFQCYPNRGIFVLDWSGSITDTILNQVIQQPEVIKEKLIKRIVYDQLGNPDWAIPFPEFSKVYGFSYEEHVQRVSTNLSRLEPELVKGAPFVAGLTFREIVPQICRVITAILDEHGLSWQITEAKKLLINQGLLKLALKNFGHRVPEAKWFLESVFLEIKASERELRTYAFMAMLGTIEPRAVRARIGSSQPGWTPAESINKGLMVLVDGSRLINQRNTQHYLFTQIYSMIMAEINKRQPGDPNDQPVALVMDEVYSLLSIPGMAEEVGMLAPLYRSRKLELYIVLQALSQLALTLKNQIWSIGNIVCFGLSSFDEAYEMGQQLFPYEPLRVKLPARHPQGQPVPESDRGQYLAIANKIQRMKHRECIIRRYESEQLQDEYIRYVPETKEIPGSRLDEKVDDLKERLLKKRGIPVENALKVINNRRITLGKKPPNLDN
jgi:hypothetical protein